MRAIVTVGVSDNRIFAPYLARFRDTFRKYGGADYMKIWQTWPPGSPTHREVHYGFKVHAVAEALARGATSVLWFDCDAYAIAPLEPLWQRLEKDGHVLVEDANRLGEWSSDHSLSVFGLTRDEAMDIRLGCGTCWGLDFTSERSRTFFERLKTYAKAEHFNGTHVSRLPGLPPPSTEGQAMSTDSRCKGHRGDEIYMPLLARELGMATHVGVEFIGGCGTVTPLACVKSGYDLPQPVGVGVVNGLLDDGVDYNE